MAYLCVVVVRRARTYLLYCLLARKVLGITYYVGITNQCGGNYRNQYRYHTGIYCIYIKWLG